MPPLVPPMVCHSLKPYPLCPLIILSKLSQSLYNRRSCVSEYQPTSEVMKMQYRAILQVLQSARPKLVAILDKLLDYALLTAIVIVLLAVPSYLNSL